MIYTTSLPVSKRIKELIRDLGHIGFSFNWMLLPRIGEWTVQYHTDNNNFNANVLSREEWVSACETMVPAITLSELPEVLKKVGEKLGWGINRVHDMEVYLYRYIKCCELHALGQNVDDYLLELLK